VITNRRKLKGKVELSEEKLVLVSLCHISYMDCPGIKTDLPCEKAMSLT
jgi:hypothetical protein